MKDSELIDTLKSYKRITPDKEYSRTSRRLILASPHTAQREIQKDFAYTATQNSPFVGVLFTSLRIGTFVSGAIAVLALSYWATQELSPLFLPGLNEQGITAEAQMVNAQIDIQVSKLSLFEKTSQESTDVLHQVTENRLDHLNDPIIKKETKQVQDAIPSSSSSASEGQAVTTEVNAIINELAK